MTKKAEEPEAAPSGDVTENEEDPKPQPEAKPPKAPALPPVIEEVQNHETVPAWFKPFGDQLSSIAEALKPKPTEPQTAPAAKQPESEVQDDKTQGKPKPKPKIKLWRTF